MRLSGLCACLLGCASPELELSEVAHGPAQTRSLGAGHELRRASCGALTHELRSRQASAAWLAELRPGNTLDLQVQRGAETVSVKVSGGTRAQDQFRAPESVSDAPEFILSH